MDQIACLASLQDVKSLTLTDPEPEANNNDDDNGGYEMERWFTFQVDQSNEMKESMEYFPGFTVRLVLFPSHRRIRSNQGH